MKGATGGHPHLTLSLAHGAPRTGSLLARWVAPSTAGAQGPNGHCPPGSLTSEPHPAQIHTGARERRSMERQPERERDREKAETVGRVGRRRVRGRGSWWLRVWWWQVMHICHLIDFMTRQETSEPGKRLWFKCAVLLSSGSRRPCVQ